MKKVLNEVSENYHKKKVSNRKFLVFLSDSEETRSTVFRSLVNAVKNPTVL